MERAPRATQDRDKVGTSAGEARKLVEVAGANLYCSTIGIYLSLILYLRGIIIPFTIFLEIGLHFRNGFERLTFRHVQTMLKVLPPPVASPPATANDMNWYGKAVLKIRPSPPLPHPPDLRRGRRGLFRQTTFAREPVQVCLRGQRVH